MDFTTELARLLQGSRMYGIRLVSLSPDGKSMLERLGDRLVEASVISEADKVRFVSSIGELTLDCNGAPFAEWAAEVSEATAMVTVATQCKPWSDQ